MRLSRSKGLSGAAWGYIWFVRGTPQLLQLVFIFDALPLIGLRFDEFTTAVIGFAFNHAAFSAELFRSGIMSVNRSQSMAAAALGMGPFLTLRRIIMPQAMRALVPGLANDTINMLKRTSRSIRRLTIRRGKRRAAPGDLLEVRVLDIELRQDWGWNAMRPLRGTLPDDFAQTRLSHVPIDRERRTTTLPFGAVLPLRPFFGVMGVAPPPVYGALSTIEPREHGGNIDNKELTVGASLFLPVHASGALFSVGDGHAVQGDGEVNLTALETSLAGVFEFHLHKAVHAPMPFALSATHVIAMGFDEDLDTAARQALSEMIGLLVQATGWAREDAYLFCSMACDLHITQMVNGEKGVHAMVEQLRLSTSTRGSHPLVAALRRVGMP